MTQITGSGASRLLGDVDHKYRSAAVGYDTELKRLIRKGIAVAGWRRGNGDGIWGLPNRPDLKTFDGFTIDDYHNQSIQFDILPRMLVPATEEETLRLIVLKRKALPFFPDEQAGKEAGYDEESVRKWIDEFEAKQEEEFARRQETEVEITEANRSPGAPPGGPQRGQTGPRSDRSNRRNERRNR